MRNSTRRGRTSPRCFIKADDGAVTVDWVVLTGAIVFLGATVAFYTTASVPDVANAIVTYMDNITVVPD